MTEDNREKFALMRYAIIAPAVTHTIPPGMSSSDFFKEAAKKSYVDPTGKERYYSASSIERWYYRYRKNGFDSLVSIPRSDSGKSRKIDDDIYQQIKHLKEKYPRIPATEILSQLQKNGTIVTGELSLSTVTRCVNRIIQEERLPVHADMRRYERPHINEVWCGDSCVGPKVVIDGEKRRIYVIALIDDASRFITGARVFYQDNCVSLMEVMKSATLKYGIPKIWNFDNGHSYKNKQMELLSARIGSTIHYCQPYTPTQKSKIERWFRTLRDKWLAITDLNEFKTLSDVQKSLDEFVLKYNTSVHTSLNGKTPEERFFSEPECIRRIDTEDTDKAFLLEIERRVSTDCVISIDNIEYEVDCRFAGRRIRLRYAPDMSAIYVVEDTNVLTPIRVLNKIENALVKREKFYLSGGES